MSAQQIESAVEAVSENFKFLVLEIRRQLEDTRRVMEGGGAELKKKLFARDDYIDNLKSVIENKCFKLLGNERLPKRVVDKIRAINVTTSNLERIGDFAVNIVGQLEYLDDFDVMMHFGPEPFFEKILESVGMVERALLEADMKLALRICRSEVAIDELYAAVFARIMDQLRAGHPPEDLVTSLFVYRYFERMGDSLLNVGEAVIFAAAGEKLKISQYQALEESLGEVDLHISDVDYEGIWETRSGARIGTLDSHEDDPNRGRWIIFKEGRHKKVMEEKEGLELWERTMPGLAPKIYGFHEHGEMASLLLQYLQGETLQKLTLAADIPRLKKGLAAALLTVETVWTRTLEQEPSRPKFVRQLQKRLPDVLKVHPEFLRGSRQVGGVEALGFQEVLDRLAPLDQELACPFSVLIHGDFNTDNLIIDPEEGTVHYIDLHRSKMFDYLQDVSVFIVSNFRLPVQDRGPRKRLNAVSKELYQFGRSFGESHGDTTFDARLAMGLARSFVTSTRFELNEDFSKTMYMRAVYLMERLLTHADSGAEWSEFRINEDVFVY